MESKWSYTEPILVESRIWRDVTYGNTYFSNRIHVGDSAPLIMPMSYGYGDQCLYEAIQLLIAKGYLPEDASTTQKIREQGIELVHRRKSVRKREMFKL